MSAFKVQPFEATFSDAGALERCLVSNNNCFWPSEHFQNGVVVLRAVSSKMFFNVLSTTQGHLCACMCVCVCVCVCV